MVLLNAEKLSEVRRRLSDISWWMRCTAKTIASQANKEDQTTGRFWQGRYRAQLLLSMKPRSSPVRLMWTLIQSAPRWQIAQRTRILPEPKIELTI